MGTQSLLITPVIFFLQRFFAKWEFAAPYLLCCSDCEPLAMSDLLNMADAESLKLWNGLMLGYTETQGLPVLREEVAQMYSSMFSRDHVVILAPEEGIYLAMQALLKPGDHVIVTYPGYQSLYAVAQSMGCTVSMWEPHLMEGGAIRFDVQTLQALVSSNTKAVVVNFPHNPTGATLSRSDWEQLVAICKAASCYLFSDEMYRLLEHSNEQQLPPAAGMYSKAVSLSGVSKSFSLPGLRIGWLASQDIPFLQRVLELKDYTTICPAAPSEVLALIALRAQDKIVAANLEIIQANTKLFDDFVAEFNDWFEWQAPCASSVAFPRLKSEEPIEEFCNNVVMSAGVLLLPSTVYDHQPSVDRGYFRIGLGRKNFPECLAKLREFLKASRT